MENQIRVLNNDVDWLKETSMHHGEKIAEMEIRLNKKHEEIVEIKQEENKKRERELQFLENMTKISALLDKVTSQLDKTQREVDDIQKNYSVARNVMKQLEEVQSDSKRIRQDVDFLIADKDSRKDKTESVRWSVVLFFTVFGGIITYVFTTFFLK